MGPGQDRVAQDIADLVAEVGRELDPKMLGVSFFEIEDIRQGDRVLGQGRPDTGNQEPENAPGGHQTPQCDRPPQDP